MDRFTAARYRTSSFKSKPPDVSGCCDDRCDGVSEKLPGLDLLWCREREVFRYYPYVAGNGCRRHRIAADDTADPGIGRTEAARSATACQ